MGIVFIHLFNKPPPTIIPSWLFLFLCYLSMFIIVSVTLGGKNIGPLCKWSLFVRTKLTTVGLNMHKTLKKCSNKPNIFLIPLSMSEVTTSQNFFVNVWPPGGVIITFAENWNFVLKFFLVNSFKKKWLLDSFGSISCPKMGLKAAKTLTHLVAKITLKQSSFGAL